MTAQIGVFFGLSPTLVFIGVTFLVACVIFSGLVLLVSIWANSRGSHPVHQSESPEPSIEALLEAMDWDWPDESEVSTP